MRSIRWFCLPLTAVLLLLFGNGCSSGGGTAQPPSALTYTVGTAVYTKSVPIPANTPSSAGGAVASYRVDTALPAGLSLNSSTGVISGTPLSLVGTSSYNVTASNLGGSTSAALTITVNDLPPSALSYTIGTAVYISGVPILADSPSSSGGVVIAYSVSPGLPPGLNLSATTGVIGGTPSTASAAATYTVTASNSGGSTTAALTITVRGAPAPQAIPNLGQQITPLAPLNSRFEPLVPGLIDNPDWQAGQAVTSVVSPDGNTLLVLTSGYNRVFTGNNVPPSGFNWPDSEEYVFIYDISAGVPVQRQVLKVPNTYNGIVFDPGGKAFYVSGGIGDFPYYEAKGLGPYPTGNDTVHVFTLSADATSWAEALNAELDLGHKVGLGLSGAGSDFSAVNNIVQVRPCAAGIAISKDGQTLVVANYFNDSITVFTGGLGNWSSAAELDLRPGKSIVSPQPGVPGGEYPFWVAVKGNGASATAYVSSLRDREIDVVSLSGTPVVTARISVKGQPNKMTLNAAQSLLYVVEDQSDTVDVIDTVKNVILEMIPVIAPASVMPAGLAQYKGANSNSVALSPDETQLYVTNGNLNSVAVVPLNGTNHGDQAIGLIPTGWYPNSVSFSGDGKWVYVVNGKSPTGPNAGFCYAYGPVPGHTNCVGSQQYNPQLIKAGFQTFPRPDMKQLTALTAQVAANNHFSNTESASDAAVMLAVRSGIQHVIFIIKENRTYDQVLGDLEVGNGDPSLTEFGKAITPNLHNLARNFVTLDNFLASSETSTDGWPWTTSAQAPDIIERQFPLTYAGRGLSLDSEGNNRSVNVAIPTAAGRTAANPLTPNDPDLLAGQTNVGAPDGPDNELNTGYLWDAALREKLSVRNYGFFVDTTLYPCPTNLAPCQTTPPAGTTLSPILLLANPFLTNTTVAYPTSVSLTRFTDPYFRGFDNQFPDYYRFKEWEREFDTDYAKGGLPALSLVRFMHDHTGDFGDPGGFEVNIPETQQADNDYAVGLLVQKIANSSYASNTLIFVIEDDSQDGGDHVDSHRTVAFVAGPYVKQQALVSSPFNTINFVRTIEEVLGLKPMNLNDALARPMADVFNTTPSKWSFTATPSAYLYCTTLSSLLPAPAQACPPLPHTASYWARVTKGMDFTSEDRFDFKEYNGILWKGLMGDKPYPAKPTGLDLRKNRTALLANYRRALKHSSSSPAPKMVTD